jgi:histone H3/H4
LYDDARAALVDFLRKVIADTVYYVEHGRRRTVTPVDVCMALKRQGRTLYGYGL